MTKPQFVKDAKIDPGAIDTPGLFRGTRQYVFHYIWNNPGCTVADILSALSIVRGNHRLVHMHIDNIERLLAVHTPWRLLTRRIHDGRPGQPPKTFKIVKLRTLTHARTDLTPILPGR